MLPFRQLVSSISVALVVLQTHQYLHGTGQALARPVGQNSVNDAFNRRSTQPGTAVPASDGSGEATMNPEAVLKALKALTEGIQSQSDGQNRQPVMVISHGEGGPIKPSTSSSASNAKPTDSGKKSKEDPQPNKNKNKNKNDKDKSGKSKSNDAAKAVLKALQQPRTRFCAQAANTNGTIDDISQTLVKKDHL